MHICSCNINNKSIQNSNYYYWDQYAGQCGSWGTLAKWLERTTDEQVIVGSNPTGAAWKLWQFSLPNFASSFRRDTKCHCSLLSGVYARGSKYMWSMVAQLVECRTRNRESPGSNPRCYRFEVWAFSFTSRRLSRLSCINDSGGNVSE